MMARENEETVTGVVEYAGFYQTDIGRPDRCVVFLRVERRPRMLVFDSDLRDQFPLGRTVRIRFRPSLDNTVTLLERKLI